MSLTPSECNSLLSKYKSYLRSCATVTDRSTSSEEINTTINGLTFCGTYKPTLYKEVFEPVKENNELSISQSNNIKILLDPNINRVDYNKHLACSYLQNQLVNIGDSKDYTSIENILYDRIVCRNGTLLRIIKHNCDSTYYNILGNKKHLRNILWGDIGRW